MVYEVEITVSGHYILAIEADSEDEALDRAIDEADYYDAEDWEYTAELYGR